MLLFLALELGLAWLLLYFKLRARGDGQVGWTAAYRFWARVFALAFVLSFAAALPVLIQFGSLWPLLMEKIGDVAGPLLGAGVLSAYVFKSCFLGGMLFGQRNLSERAHTLMVLMVAIGVTVSVFWLLVLLSWMHTPDGAVFADGQYQVHDWAAVIFNPATVWYVALFVLAAALVTAFLIMGVVAAQSLRRPVDESGRLVFRSALWLAAVSALLLGMAAAGAGRMVANHQPAKAAATVAYWDSSQPADLVLFAWPNTQNHVNERVWSLKGAAESWLGRDQSGAVQGLDKFSGMSPPVHATFWSFRLAVVTGLLMLLTAWLALLRAHKAGYEPGELSKGLRYVLVAMSCSGGVLLLAGLAYVMVGAYPYAVQGTITMSEIVSESSVAVLLGGYLAHLVIYALLLVSFFQMLRHIARFGVIPVARRRGRA